MKIHVTAFPVGGSYRLQSLPASEARCFEPVESCPACASSVVPRVLAQLGQDGTSAALQLRMCATCGHVTYSHLPTGVWLQEYYQSTWDAANRLPPPTSRKLHANNPSPWSFHRHFEDLGLPKDVRILDFGCGFGDGLLALEHMGYRQAFGVELGAHRVAVARRHFGDRVQIGSLAAAELYRDRGGPFDVIILNHVAEHLGDPFEVISQLSRLLSSGGMLVVAVPNVGSESPVHLPLYFPHLHHFSPTSLMRLLARAGGTPYRWERSEVQLAVVGVWSSRTIKSEAYSTKEQAITPEYCRKLAAYVSAPWQNSQNGGGAHLAYFHPWISPWRPAGFAPVNRKAVLWLAAAQKSVVPAIHFGERVGIDRHNIGRRIFRRMSQLLCGRDNIPALDILSVSRDDEAVDGVPWIVGDAGEIPILVK